MRLMLANSKKFDARNVHNEDDSTHSPGFQKNWKHFLKTFCALLALKVFLNVFFEKYIQISQNDENRKCATKQYLRPCCTFPCHSYHCN